MSAFLDPLCTTEVTDVIFEISQHPFRYQSDVAKRLFTVPVGFFTDFESMPRWVPMLYALLGDQAHEPAVVHDWLYYSAVVDRQMADNVLFEAMDLIGIPSYKKHLIWFGLRIGGWAAWNKHRKDGNPQAGKFSDSPDIAGLKAGV
jgi:hypothetical protein